MRLVIPCMKCAEEFGYPSELSQIEIRDDGRYEVECPLGHRTTTVLHSQKFEVLFEIGAHAILDGYYREAVSSFTSSLERFYEFGIRTFLARTSKSDELFKSCWKQISNQSERQIGAYLFLWASNFCEAPSLLPTQQVKFRNDVIHKGKIPSRSDAIAFGNCILEILRPQMLQLRSKLKEDVEKVAILSVYDGIAESDKLKPSATMSIGTIVSLIHADSSYHQLSLEEHLQRIAASIERASHKA